jgi:D-glycero-alpha-D-manno-heptose-7-phosphate kinase
MIISKTPFRISFCGGGTDIQDYYKHGYGAVVSSAIDKHVYIAIHKFFDNEYVLKYSQTEIVPDIASIKHPLIRECLRLTETTDFLEISSFADIPAKGSGLGSSSAFSVGLIKALMAQKGIMTPAYFCADGACKVEIDHLGEPIGKQDQFAAAYGGLNYIRFEPNGMVKVEPIILSSDKYKELNNNLVLFYTGVTRSASEILRNQQKISQTAEYISRMDAIRLCANQLRDSLSLAYLDAVGYLMHESWMLKRVNDGVSNNTFNDIYNRAINAGALGGKILGAGGGGFFLFYTKDKPKLIAELSDLRHIEFNLEQQGSNIIYYQH